MKAVVLIGGEGTRLRPLTCNIPKAAVPILNRPFMEHLLRYLEKHGVRDIILAMGYLPDPIQRSLGGSIKFGGRLNYLIEEFPLGTAGAVKNAESFLDRTFLVFNGDILTGIDLTAMMRRHREIKPKVSIALTPVDNPTTYGIVETNAQGMVQRFVEKPSWDKVTTNLINAGIYILEPEVLVHVPKSTPSMFENYLFPRLLKMGEPILSYHSDAYWIDIGTPEKYLKVNHDLLLQQGVESVRLGKGSKIHHTSRIKGPVLIGEECIIAENVKIKGPAVLGPKCEIGEGTVVEGAILWHHSRVDKWATVRNCILCSGTYVQERSQVLDNCVVGDGVTVDAGSILKENQDG